MENNNNSGVNTILIVMVLVLIVGFGVWYFSGGFSGNTGSAEDEAEFNLNVEVPTGGNDEPNGGETAQ